MTLLNLIEQLENDIRDDAIELIVILGANFVLALIFILIMIGRL